MTNEEFSNEFDILYNNIMSNQAPGLNEYEKSVFLTKAQDEILKSYFDPKDNKVQEGFDGSEKRQIDFSKLIVTAQPNIVISSTGSLSLPPSSLFPFADGKNHKYYALPPDCFIIINEIATVTRGDHSAYLTVIPLSYKEVNNVLSKPYKRPPKNQAWRILSQSNSGQIELVAGNNDTITQYVMRYLRRPKAIRLTDLEGVTLGGLSKAQECELDPILHQEILQRAVELAKAAYSGDLQSQLALGSNSQTNIGMLTQSK